MGEAPEGEIPAAVVEMAVRRGPIAQAVCPAEDACFTPVHWLGWRLVHRGAWGENPLNNVVLCYLERRWPRRLLNDALSVSAWVLLFAVEVAVYAATLVTRSLHYPLLLLLGEVLLLPLLVGLWTQVATVAHYGRIAARLPLEEIAATRMKPRELLVGLGLRPMIANVGAARISSILLFVLHVGFVLGFASRTSLISCCDAVTILVLLLYRGFIVGACAEYASVLALRCCVFYPTRTGALLRAMRDWVWPYGILPAALPMVVVGAWLATARVDGLVFVTFLVPPLVLWLMFALPGFMRDRLEDVMFWLERSHRQWSLYTGEPGPGAPSGFLSRWKLEKRLR